MGLPVTGSEEMGPVRVAARNAVQVSNEKMVIDLPRAEEAMLESRKRKRQTKETKERGKAVRAKTNGAMSGRAPPQTPRADAMPGSESQEQPMTGLKAERSAPNHPEEASKPATGAASAAASIAPEVAAVTAEQRSGDGKAFQVLALPSAEARGHTGYLTFARRLVEFTEP